MAMVEDMDDKGLSGDFLRTVLTGGSRSGLGADGDWHSARQVLVMVVVVVVFVEGFLVRVVVVLLLLLFLWC